MCLVKVDNTYLASAPRVYFPPLLVPSLFVQQYSSLLHTATKFTFLVTILIQRHKHMQVLA